MKELSESWLIRARKALKIILICTICPSRALSGFRSSCDTIAFTMVERFCSSFISV